MGRIVIPRVRQEARQQLQRKRRTGYFANGFGPQEMKLVMQLADLAVAGGGQIARAVQISNREKEQADYDRRLESDIENRQRAAQAEVDEAQMASGPQAFAASFFADQPGVAPVSVKEQLIRDASAFRGARQTRGAPIVATGGMAPEDIQRFAVGQRPKTPTQLPGYGVSTGRYMPHETMPGLMEPPGAPTAAMTREDVLLAAEQAFADGRTAEGMRLIAAGDPSSTPHDLPMPMRLTRPAGFEEARLAAQQRDFRQEAIEAAGPAPERKLFRIADILAAAPSARTVEQRAMLLQAAADSPDIQAANLSDLAKGAYRDRAMQAVMKLFPEEEEALSELDMLRMQSMRESMETENLRQQKLQAALDKEAAKLSRQAKRGGGTGKSRELMEQAAYLTKNYPKWKAGEIDPERWRFNTGPFWSSTPSSLAIDGQNAGLRGSDLKALRSAESRMLSSERTAQAGDRIQLTKERLENAKLRAKSTRDNAARRYNLDVQKFQARADARAAEKSYLAKLQGDLSTEEKRLAAEDYAADMNRLAFDAAGLDAPAQRSGVDAVVEAQRKELERRKKARKEGE